MGEGWGQAEHKQTARPWAGREARRPRNRPRYVLAGDPCPAVNCLVTQDKACMLDTLPVRITSKHRLVNTAVRAEQEGLVFTLWEPCTYLWVWGHAFARLLAGGVSDPIFC